MESRKGGEEGEGSVCVRAGLFPAQTRCAARNADVVGLGGGVTERHTKIVLACKSPIMPCYKGLFLS